MGAAEKLPEPTNRKFKIFVVEDSDIYRELLTRFIQTIDRDYPFNEDKGYDIRSFRTGEECISNLFESPDIVVLDYFLNGYTNDCNAMDGMETLRQIKMLTPRTHVVVITSQGNQAVASEFIRNGASDYISKEPGVRERLQHSVSKIIRIIKDKEQTA
jgi:CheY-like chemotaxis protein